MPITLSAGEQKQLDAQLTPRPTVSIELVKARFDDGQPMVKKPGDSFTLTLTLKNNLMRDWSPGNILFGFGKANAEFLPSPIVWGFNPFTGEVEPQSCGTWGKWPLQAWPVIPPGATRDFQITYGLCPAAGEGVYDGYVEVRADSQAQRLTLPGALTVVWPKLELAILDARLYNARIGTKYGRSKIYGSVDVSVRNDTGKVLSYRSPDYVEFTVEIYRTSDNARVGFCRISNRDIPTGTNTITLTPSIGYGSDVPLQPGALDYRLYVRITLRGWPGQPYAEGTFYGSTVLS